MGIFSSLKKELNRSLTVMLVPHNHLRPWRLTFTLSFFLILLAIWSGITIWAGYLVGRHIDYWKTKVDYQILKLKVAFFSDQLQKSHQLLDTVRKNDQQVRALLKINDRKKIITANAGGPLPYEASILKKTLAGKIHEITHQEIYQSVCNLRQRAEEELTSTNEVLQEVNNLRSKYNATPNRWPCFGPITSPFGFRIHPVYGSYEFHSGLDIAAPPGTPVTATANGSVILAQWAEGYGLLVVLDHGYGYRTYYGHLSKILVHLNQKIKRGQVIGLVGDTGTSTGPHLHYEVQVNNNPVNPAHYLSRDNFFKRG